MKDLALIRGELSAQQREAITAIWNHYLQNNWEWPITRLIHQKFGGKTAFLRLLDEMPEGIWFIEETRPLNKYHLTLLGILVTNNGEEIEKLIANYLKYALFLVNQDANRSHISSAEAQQALAISELETNILGRVLLLLQIDGSIGEKNWNLSVPEDIEDLPENAIEYVRMSALRHINQKPNILDPKIDVRPSTRDWDNRKVSKTQHPWQIGPTELIEFALDRMHKGDDFDRRLAFLVLDVGVETLFKTFLTLPDSAMKYQINRDDRFKAAKGNFPELLRAVQNSNPEKAALINFSHIEHYHNLRNMLYHQGNQVTAVPMNQVEGYGKLAAALLHEYLDVDLSENLVPPPIPTKSGDDPVVNSVEVEVSFGRFRIEQLKSYTIRALSLNTGTFETPLLPFLRHVVEELELPVEFTFKNGGEKNTRALGKDVINELKPSAWHRLVPGQKIQKDKLVSMLTGRIREGEASEKKWAKVDFIRNLKDDVLVFQPTGKAFGNSPFNLNCWVTENGKSIRQD